MLNLDSTMIVSYVNVLKRGIILWESLIGPYFRCKFNRILTEIVLD